MQTHQQYINEQDGVQLHTAQRQILGALNYLKRESTKTQAFLVSLFQFDNDLVEEE